MRVTHITQSRFEELYYTLSETHSDYTISAMIAAELQKSTMAVYMHFRRAFSGGYEHTKRTLIDAMEQIVEQEVAA